MAASIAFQQAQTAGGVGSTSGTLTFTAASAAGQERLVALCGIAKNSIATTDFTSVTIDGQAATQVGPTVRATDTGSNGSIVAFFRAAGTANTSVTVSFSVSSSGSVGLFDHRGALWSLNDAGTLFDTGSSAHSGPPPGGAFTPVTLDLDTVTDGVVAAIQMSYASSNTFTTWTGLTERYDGGAAALYTGDWFTVADLNVGSASTPLAVSTTQTANYSPNSALSALAVSFNTADGGGGGGGQQIIDIGDAIDDGTGDPVRVAFDKCNDNFTELYTADTAFLTTTTAAATYAPLASLSAYQPLDADLTAIAALTGTNTIHYRSGTSAWTAVTIGTGLSFTGGTLAASGGTSITFNVQTFTASGTYTPTASPSAMRYCTIEAVGGGGGGGGSGNTTGAAAGMGGGGSGGYSRVTASAATIGASQAVTIGAAGTAGAAAGGNGGAGGTTSVGTICVANGGGGGIGFTTGTMGGGAGGNLTGAVGNVTAAGMPGIGGLVQPINTATNGGNGGSSQLGGGGRGAVFVNGNSSVGTAALANSGGGGGGSAGDNVATTRIGGAGGSGFVIITEYL